MAILIRFVLLFAVAVLITRVLRKLFLLPASSDFPKYNKSNTGHKDPYEILEISKSTDLDGIKKAYLKQLAKYHPDKVEHLGKDLQDLAKQRTQEIIWAYKNLTHS